MKKVLFLLLLLTSIGQAQTASWLGNTSNSDTLTAQSVSLGNPYLMSGVKLSMPLNAGANFTDNLLFSVRFRKDIYSSSTFVLPIVSNTSLGNWGDINDTSAVLGDNGVSVGIYPYFRIVKGNLIIIPHFEFSGRIIPDGGFENSKKVYKIAGNIELQLPKETGDKNTISAGIFYTSNYNIVDKSTVGLDITGIINIDPHSAILLDYKKPFGNGLSKDLFSLGLIVKK